VRGHDLFRIATVFAAVLCYATILLGGNVMANGDGLGCPHWPTCYPNGKLLPAFQGPAAVEWSHRVFAFFLSLAVLVVAILGLVYERGRRVLLRLALASLGLVVGEALLGGLVVERRLSAELVLAHLGLATALFGLLLILVLLSNLRDVPRRWVDWARRATEETPPAAPADGTAAPSPFGGGLPVGRSPEG
jgi:heme A synthase